MDSYCKVLSARQKDPKAPKFLSFEDLMSQTCIWLDEMEAVEDIFKRQTYKVIEGGIHTLNAKHFVESSKQEIIDAERKLEAIDKELTTSSFNLDVLELFLQSIERQSPELTPATIDCQRFPIYQTMLGFVSMFDFNKDLMESFYEEYEKYSLEYRKNFVITSILGCHNTILQNLSSSLDDLEKAEKSNELQINDRKQQMHLE